MASETFDHEANHGGLDHDLAGLGQVFVVLAETAIPAQPCESSLHYPTTGLDLKPFDASGALDDLKHPATHPLCPVNQLACVATICPNQAQTRQEMLHLVEHQLGPVPILHIGGMDDYGQNQAQGIEQDMAFASVDLLACVISSEPRFSVVFTDWLSRTAALGSFSRPTWLRVRPRRAS